MAVVVDEERRMVADEYAADMELQYAAVLGREEIGTAASEDEAATPLEV